MSLLLRRNWTGRLLEDCSALGKPRALGLEHTPALVGINVQTIQ